MAKYFSAQKMGPENEECCSQSDSESYVTAHETTDEQSKITYTRDFLLPFAKLDICRELPCGFDPSNLRVFDDACNGVVQRHRTPGDASFLDVKSSEKGSSQYNRDLDFTRHYSNQHQLRWHDGILGSRTFQRVPAFTTGASDPWNRGIDNGLLKRSDAPYCPPCPYKGQPHSRRENNGSYNVETLGSAEFLREGRQDEERKRQASSELMRKEQQNATQAKHKQIADVHEKYFDPDDPSLLEDSTKMLLNENCEYKDSMPPPVSNNEFANKMQSTQTAAPGPPFPPGFLSRVSEKNLGTNSSTNSTISEEHVREGYMKNSVSFSSNFAHSFLEEEKKLAGVASRGDEKCGSEVQKVSDGRSTTHDHPNFSSKRNELVAKPIISPKTSTTDEISEKSYSFDDPTVKSGVHISEYLAQSILSDSSRNRSVQRWSGYDTENEQPMNNADDEGASQHLLPLLQKGESLKDLGYSSELHRGSSDKINPFEFQNASSVPNRSSKGNIDKSKRNPPLREIFGTCIEPKMQSNEAPFSIQRCSVGRITQNHDLERYTVPPSVAENIFFPSTADKCRSIGTIGEHIPSKVDKCRSIGTIGEGILALNRTKQTELVDIGEHELGFDDAWANAGFHPHINQDSKITPVIGFENKVDSTDEICLPEEDSLITIDDMLAPLHPTNTPASDGRFLVSGLGDLPCLQGSYDAIGSENCYLNFHERKCYPKNFQSQRNQGTQFFRPLVSYQIQKSCQIKSRNPKFSHHKPPLFQHLPHNLLPRPFQNTHNEPTRFDRPVRHSPLEQMQLEGNFPHLLSGLSKGTPLHPTNLTFCRGNPNPMQKFPLNGQQPSYAVLGDFGDGGNNNQVAIDRLLEMKLRAKQIQSFPRGGHGQGNISNSSKRESGMEKQSICDGWVL